jgi:hypothetical protein
MWSYVKPQVRLAQHGGRRVTLATLDDSASGSGLRFLGMPMPQVAAGEDTPEIDAHILKRGV